ncbi:tetratricopeptide repeat protein [Candidatus Contendibacter odensensis]|uniref:tetratricopeptide repeat protein n=1 Tax=Candidatus Contendibacter odensensis TaxID=1400860 RepID=UPI0009DCE83E
MFILPACPTVPITGKFTGGNNLGKVYAELGRWEEAIARFRWAVALRPDFNEARHNLEQALRSVSQPGGLGGHNG